MPSKIRDLARKILHDPAEINIAISKPPAKIVQQAYVVYEPQKIPLVKWLLKSSNNKSTLIFCSKKHNVKQLTMELRRSKFNVNEIHSDLDQSAREEVLLQFKSQRLPILVATDILSRGIDIDNIEMVINYDVPNDGEDYVHRIGRTARAETDGTAVTFISEKEQNKFKTIEDLLGHAVNKATLPEEFGKAPEYHPGSKGGKSGRGRRDHNPGHNNAQRHSGKPNPPRRANPGDANSSKHHHQPSHRQPDQHNHRRRQPGEAQQSPGSPDHS
jgi:superfamily II DNA/RNA helicase